jgi:hypothetical protein
MGQTTKNHEEFKTIAHVNKGSNEIVGEIPYKQFWKGRKINFDPDSSPIAWENFKKVYTVNHWNLIEKFDMGDVQFAKFDEESKEYLDEPEIDHNLYNRLYAFAKNGEDFCSGNHVFRLGGDCDFNFVDDKYKAYKKMLNDDRELVASLDACYSMHCKLVNFSLMPATGGMNNTKGKLFVDEKGAHYNSGESWRPDCYDRLDTFIYCLDQYFKNGCEVILSESVYYPEPLKKYLSYFNNNIYDYCKKIYFLNDKNFIDRLICEGQKPIKNGDDVVRYMKLAQDFWQKKNIPATFK